MVATGRRARGPRRGWPARRGRAARRWSPAPWCGRARPPAHGCGQGSEQLVGGERPVQPQLEHPDPLPRVDEVGDRLAHRLATRAHDDDDPLGLGVTRVLRDPVGPAGVGGHLVHDLLHQRGHAGVEGVDRLAGLEVHVGVLGGAAHERVLGVHCARTVFAHEVLGHHRTQHVVVDELDGVELVRGAEAVEEVHERHPGAQRRRLRDEGEVVGLLHRRRRQQGEAGLPHRHHVGAVAEDLTGPAPPASGRRRGTRSGARLTGDLYMFGIIRSRPWDAVNVALSAPPCSRGTGASHRLRPPRSASRRPWAPSPHVGAVVTGPLVGEVCPGDRRARRDRVDRAASSLQAVGDGPFPPHGFRRS